MITGLVVTYILLVHHYGLELNRDDYIRTITLPTLLPLSV